MDGDAASGTADADADTRARREDQAAEIELVEATFEGDSFALISDDPLYEFELVARPALLEGADEGGALTALRVAINFVLPADYPDVSGPKISCR